MTIPRVTARAGFSLVELMVTLVLFGLVMAAATQAIVRQQRFYRGAGELLEMRSHMRQGITLLTTDLRPVFPKEGDIYEWSRSRIAFRSILGSSVVCHRPTTSSIVVPPATLIQDNTLTTWLTAPVVGDSLLLYDEGREVGNADDLWTRHAITEVLSVTGVNACLPATGFTLVGDLAPSTKYTISPAMSTTVVRGGPIRFFRRVDYTIYQASDSQWYLGASDCLPGRSPVCSALQPVSGPHRPLSGATTSGLLFSYYDTAGVQLDPAIDARTRIARIGLLVRGETTAPYGSADYQRDSVSFSIGLRNRF